MLAPYQPDHRLRTLLASFGTEEDAAITPLADLKREIRQYGKRRCDDEASLDNLKYYLGFAFQANGALDVDSLAFTGLLSLPAGALLAIFSAGHHASASFVDLIRSALEDAALREWARAKGVWLQWKRLEAIYRQEVEDFRNSDAFARPGWRRKSITRDQEYMIGEIQRILGVPEPKLATRGQAFEFIAAHGGNPRFLVEPPLPAEWQVA